MAEDAEAEYESCDECAGNGFVDCPSCGGYPDEDADEEDECEDCGGTGEVMCDNCEGEGEVLVNA